jgi:hypothetical protein
MTALKWVLKPGDRVRCIDADVSLGRLTQGKEYTVRNIDCEGFVRLRDALDPDLPQSGWYECRFKPVVRVKVWGVRQ